MKYALVQQVKHAAVHLATVDVQGKGSPDKLAPSWKLETL